MSDLFPSKSTTPDLDFDAEPFDPDPTEPTRTHRRPGRLFLLIGLVIGLGIGLGYSWGLSPVQFYNTDPVDLHPTYKETWILLVAAAYRQDGDLDRALNRLASLEDPQIGQTVAQLTERYIQQGKPASRIRALASLADALGARTAGMLIYLTTPEPTLFFTATPHPPTSTATASPSPLPTTVTPTRTPRPSLTPTVEDTPTAAPTLRPTRTRPPTPTTPPPYVLQRSQRLCEADQGPPRIEVFVQTAEGAGIPGSEVWITWRGGVDRFVTGLKPEIGLGYADFAMSSDVVYAVAVGDPTQQLIGGLSAEPCQPDESDSPRASWQLIVVANEEAFTPTPTATPHPLTPTPTPAPTQTWVVPQF